MNGTTNSLPAMATVSGGKPSDSNGVSTGLEQMSGPERDRHRARLKRKEKTDSTRTLRAEDPRQWVGKKVRNKKTGATYVIRQIYKSNRVELEKSWMTYSSDLPAIRTDYEICF